MVNATGLRIEKPGFSIDLAGLGFDQPNAGFAVALFNVGQFVGRGLSGKAGSGTGNASGHRSP